MIWRRKAQGTSRDTPGGPITPADAADLAAARAALEKIRMETEIGRSRWPIVLATVSYLKRVHQENHLADDLNLIFTSTRRG